MKFEEFPLRVPNLKTVEKKINGFIESLKNASSEQEAYKIVKKFEKYGDSLSADFAVIQIRYSLDTKNPEYVKANKKADQILPMIEAVNNVWNKTIVNHKYRPYLEKKLGTYYFTMIENSLRCFDDKIVPELIQINELSSEYDQVMGSAEIPFDGKVLNLSQIGKYTTSVDREVRKQASIALDKWMGEHEQHIGEIYDKLVKLRHQMALKLGFKDFTELGYLSLGRTDYNAEMVKGYRKQIADTVVPVCQKLYKEQAKRLNMKQKDMAFYDYSIKFLDGNPEPAGDEKYLVGVATKMYEDMGSETSEFFHFMLDNHLMDLDSRPGKAPGGYMSFIPKYNCPFIFSNFNGTEGDVNVLTHEVGHALQAYLSAGIKVPEYRSPTLEACEIHSMSMEFFAWPYMEGFFGKDYKKYLRLHLEDAIEFLPYGISIDEFQHWVYAHPEATHEDRCKEWLRIEKAYTPHKVYKDCPTFAHGAYWIRQSHIFGMPFYYIDYTLAQVCAMQFLVEMHKDREKAWKKYIKLCKLGGKYPFVSLLQHAHIRNPFIDGNVAKTIRPSVKILKGLDY